MKFAHCRFCREQLLERGGVKYGTRHYAHFECYLDAGKKLSDLPASQVDKFPHTLLEARGLIFEAAALTAQQSSPSED